MNCSRRARYSRRRRCCGGGRSSEVCWFCSGRLLASRRQPVPPSLAFGSVTRTLSWHCVMCLAPTLLLGRGGRSLHSSPSYREAEYRSGILVSSELWRNLFFFWKEPTMLCSFSTTLLFFFLGLNFVWEEQENGLERYIGGSFVHCIFSYIFLFLEVDIVFLFIIHLFYFDFKMNRNFSFFSFTIFVHSVL